MSVVAVGEPRFDREAPAVLSAIQAGELDSMDRLTAVLRSQSGCLARALRFSKVRRDRNLWWSGQEMSGE